MRGDGVAACLREPSTYMMLLDVEGANVLADFRASEQGLVRVDSGQ